MMPLNIEREAQQAITLIKSFSLELHTYGPESQVLYWLNQYRAPWIRDAIIEAVYQGRYKIISVQHILSIWERRGQPVRHFTSGFEQIIASHLGAPIHLPPNIASQPKDTAASFSLQKTASQFIPMTGGLSDSNVKIDKWEETSSFSRTDYSGLAIEAFPVKDVDTLVEVYQADMPDSDATYETALMSQAPTFNSLSFSLAQTSTTPDSYTPAQSKVYASPATSAPIQPFRPKPRNKG
ncbi:hypothetical protein [Leptothoe spongobia]|uniref:Uncharacterized protein n=1 Tax=Leptothoe spongobia TAU-MAC 1115 TaxID=1967444 RepID=A0A947DCF6_9CYAN|nr:hypothetical protein [Leptothoe spongobia]MBT9314253.1 hypothetical protein [Leptothoe spongobia TAU-MAC 1115]